MNPLNASPLIFPILGCLHLLGFILLVGTTSVVDFRLIGLGMRRQSPADLAKHLAPWTSSGLVVVLLTGPLLFSADPRMYELSGAFQVKMICLLLAIVFQFTIRQYAIHRRAASAAGSGGKVIGFASLALWISVIAGGLFMGFA